MFENFNEDDFLADLNQAIKEEEEKVKLAPTFNPSVSLRIVLA